MLGSPVELRIEAAQATPGRCYAFGAGLGANGPVPLGRTARFTLVSCDISGTRRSAGGDQFLVQITPLKSANHLSLRCKIADLNNGAYTVAWSPPFSGGYKVHITLRGLPIFSSPFVVKVEGSGQYVPGSTLIATRASDMLGTALSPEEIEKAIAANPSPTLRGLRSAPDPSPTKLRQTAILYQSPGPAADAAASLAAGRACTEAAQAATEAAVVERVAAARAAAAGGKATAVALARAAIDAKLREAQQLDESDLEGLGLPPTPRASTRPTPPLGGFAAATAASRAAALSPRAAAAAAGGAAAGGAAAAGGGVAGGAAGAGAAGARGGASSAGAAGRPMAAASVRPFLSASASAEELLAAARVAAPRDDLDKLLARFRRAIDEDDADEQHADALRGLSDEANRTLGRAEELAEALDSVYGHARFGDVESGSTTAARGMATPGSARSTAQGRERAFSPD